MSRPLSPIHRPLDLDTEYVGEGRNEVCVCGHRLGRHTNPHGSEMSPTLIVTERCVDCVDCKGFRMPIANRNSPAVPPPTRISRLAALDQRLLSGTVRSLGPGGASAVYEQAVRKALIEDMADQLRAQGQIGQWAAEIIAAFREE